MLRRGIHDGKNPHSFQFLAFVFLCSVRVCACVCCVSAQISRTHSCAERASLHVAFAEWLMMKYGKRAACARLFVSVCTLHACASYGQDMNVD